MAEKDVSSPVLDKGKALMTSPVTPASQLGKRPAPTARGRSSFNKKAAGPVGNSTPHTTLPAFGNVKVMTAGVRLTQKQQQYCVAEVVKQSDGCCYKIWKMPASAVITNLKPGRSQYMAPQDA